MRRGAELGIRVDENQYVSRLLVADSECFGALAFDRLTIDEESSGIIDAEEFLGAGTFIFDAQIHTAKGLPAGTGPGTVQEYVERGQLLTMKVDDWSAVYGD